jgi:hypothetical protein
MIHRVRCALVLVSGVMTCVAATSSSAYAQTVRGRVVDDAVTPLAGVVVVATADDSRDTVRAVTGRAGQFELRWRNDSGQVSLRLLRIGFQPRIGPAVTVRAGAVVVPDIVFDSRAVTLASLKVRGSSSCRLAADSLLAVSQLWEEVDKALVLEALTGESRAIAAEWLEYQRRHSRRSGVQETRSLRIGAGMTRRIFRSRPPMAIARDGFVVSAADTTLFSAPDPDVLRSTAFRNSHCFAVRTVRGRSDTIGVDFRPAALRPNIVDISGTAWLATNPLRLTRIEFVYEGLPASADSADRSGFVAFDTLDGAAWMVTRWQAKLPRFERRGAVTVNLRGASRLSAGERIEVIAVDEAGGFLRRATGEGATSRWIPAERTVLLLHSADSVQLQGASMSLLDGELSAPAQEGLVDLGVLPPGRWGVRLASPLLDSLGATRPARDIDVEASAPTVVEWTLPRVSSLAGACDAVADPTNNGVLMGEVVAGDTGALRQLKVRLVFDRLDTRALRAGVVRKTLDELQVVPNERGRWRVCGLARGSDVTASITRAGTTIRQTVRIDALRPFTRIRLELPAVSDSLPAGRR